MAKRATREPLAPEWRLAIRAPIEAYDEYTESTVQLVPGQVDPTKVESLIIDFRYFSADGETSRRSVLCWQCGRVGERIYIRRYCPFREQLRTFRIDRMQDVIAFQNGREVAVNNIKEFFAAFAADHTDEDDEMLRLASRHG